MTDGFNFKLGRMRMNVERKREFVRKHSDELENMETELRMTCPHERKNIKVVDEVVELNDFHNRRQNIRSFVCSVCGFKIKSMVLPSANNSESVVPNGY